MVAATVFALGCSGDPELDALTQEQIVCARGSTVDGIDVSFWQGTIDWNQVRSTTVRYAFIRAYYGANTRDSQFDRNWREARRVGLLRGAYQWFKPLQDPALQADRIVAAVGRLGAGDLPVVADVEEPPADGIPSRAEYARRLRIWYDRVQAGTGRAPILYSGKYYWEGYLATTAFNTAPLWHPQYTSAACPNIANQWSNWRFWQFSSTSRVAGIAGNVDRNRFNGTMADLNALAGIGVAVQDAGVDRPTVLDVPRDTVAVRDVTVDVTRDVAVDAMRDASSDLGTDAALDAASDATSEDASDGTTSDAGDDAGDDAALDVVDESPALGDAGNVDESPTADTGDLQGGCSCDVPGPAHTRGTVPWSAALVALAALRRRRRS